MEIISNKNEKIKFLKKLQNKKERKEKGLFIAETEKLIQEALNAGYELIELYYSDNEPKIECCNKIKISKSVMAYVSSLSTPSNLLALFRIKEKSPNNSHFLILENIQDPSNLGAITRSAFGAGFNDVYCIDCVDEYDQKCLRSSMGAIFHLNIIKTTIDAVKTIECDELMCASMEGENIYLQAPFPKIVGLVIGNEGHGVSECLRNMCTKTVSIPMQEGLESLNASVSAGLIMYAIKYNLKEGK